MPFVGGDWKKEVHLQKLEFFAAIGQGPTNYAYLAPEGSKSYNST
uniref:Uncharacterized protein n=1 Tax=Candidozyma auris TaxID=498019 RepID=A0A0L0NP30_CANAR